MSAWPLPATTSKADGDERRVGIEFELQGMPVDKLARVTAFTLGGELKAVSKAEFDIAVPGQGSYRVELDFALLKRTARERREAGKDASALDALAVDVLSAASSVIVPCEVVTPPLAMTALAEPMEKLTHAIRKAGGRGTRSAPFYAFGLHMNVEPPNLDSETIAAFMKAFVCLFDWIAWRGDIDPVRRATPYIRRFPRAYEEQLADPDYWPDLASLIADYLDANPTRNRALDMLPMFSEIDAAAVKAVVDDERVKARPAFHYRLANCEIDDPDWSIRRPWQRWLQIEALAANRQALDDCCRAFLADRQRLMNRFDNRWREQTEQWLQTTY